MDKLLQDGMGGCGPHPLPIKVAKIQHAIGARDEAKTMASGAKKFFFEQLEHLQRACESGLLLDMSTHLELLKQQRDKIDSTVRHYHTYSELSGKLMISGTRLECGQMKHYFFGEPRFDLSNPYYILRRHFNLRPDVLPLNRSFTIYTLSSVRRSKGDYTDPALEVLTSSYSLLVKEKLDLIRALQIAENEDYLSKLWLPVKEQESELNTMFKYVLVEKYLSTKNSYYSAQLDCLDEACRSRVLSAEEMDCLHNYIAYNYYADLENIAEFSGFSLGEDQELFQKKLSTEPCNFEFV